MGCNGICQTYKAAKPLKISRYEIGQKRCSKCSIFLIWDGVYCPCCNVLLRTKPKTTRSRHHLMIANHIKWIQTKILVTCFIELFYSFLYHSFRTSIKLLKTIHNFSYTLLCIILTAIYENHNVYSITFKCGKNEIKFFENYVSLTFSFLFLLIITWSFIF